MVKNGDIVSPRSATYAIHELAERTGFSPRTIHFYVQLGLLPKRNRVGRGTRHPQSVLDRLLRIRALKAERRTLREISLLFACEPLTAPPGPDPSQSQTPDAAPAPAPADESPASSAVSAAGMLGELLGRLDQWGSPDQVPRVSRRSRWASVPLGTGLFLVGQDLRSHELSILERIADHLRALFEEDV